MKQPKGCKPVKSIKARVGSGIVGADDAAAQPPATMAKPKRKPRPKPKA